MAEDSSPKPVSKPFRGEEPKIATPKVTLPFQRDAKEKTGNQLPETNVRRTDAQVVAPAVNPLGVKDAQIVPPYNPDPLIEAAEREREAKVKAQQEQAQQ